MPDTPPSRLHERGKAVSDRLDEVAERSTGASDVLAVLEGFSADDLRAAVIHDYWTWKRDEAGQHAGEREAEKQGQVAADEWLAA